MRFTHQALPVLFFLALPFVVALFDINVWGALGLALLGLFWLWVLTVSPLFAPPRKDPMTLETVSISHYVDKIRWCLDRLGVPYKEVHNVGLLGLFFTGRTVPRLRVCTGDVITSIGDSPAILRYLWGAYASEYGERAAFLEPSTESLAIEERLDQYGVWIQKWFYYHVLPNRRLTLHVWGINDPTLPAWQRLCVVITLPLLQAFVRRGLGLRPGSHERTVQRIEGLLDDLEQQFTDGRRTLLGGEQISYLDITLAALSGAWLFPPEYGGGRSEAVRLTETDYPPSMAKEIQNWQEKFPQLTDYVERLYREERYLVPS
jgi:glutathione S-transferase